MKSLYLKLAVQGMQKNKRLYVPYLLSCIGMVMMSYIIQSLSYSPLLHETRGGSTVEAILSLGKFVIVVFALLFLFYTNSFLIRRRKKEFGLYSILGMDRRGISLVVICESLLVAVISLTLGIAGGILLSKLAELGLLKAIHAGVDYRFYISWEAVSMAVGLYAIIFLLLLLRSLWQVYRSSSLSLLTGEQTGEKPPRANWVIALLGVICLGVAYYMALSITSPLSALLYFFAAVILVILGTYLLFIAGSVALCRLLSKKKSYYYKKQHFVSVSSMTYRMRRNGAGLASICILCTMVLVMISSTTSLYYGSGDMIESRSIRQNVMSVMLPGPSYCEGKFHDEIAAAMEAAMEKTGAEPTDCLTFCTASVGGILENDTTIRPDADALDFQLDYNNVRAVQFYSAADFAAMTGESYTLGAGEAVILTYQCRYGADSITVGDCTFTIVGESKNLPRGEVDPVPTIFLVISSFEELAPLDAPAEEEYDAKLLDAHFQYAFDLKEDGERSFEVLHALCDAIFDVECLKNQNGYGYSITCAELDRQDFNDTYGGLFFLGILLSILFTFAAATIIYYKQVSEGYEDQARFGILKKVGMTDGDIKKSINSQILTVFFAPLLMAGIHLCFALPMLWKMLQLFHLRNLGLMILVTAASFAAFGVIYALIYRATAHTYYAIVSSGEEHE